MKRNAPLYMSVFCAIAHEPKSAMMISEELGIRTRSNAVHKTIRMLHVAGVVHVVGYLQASPKGVPSSLWKIGAGPDVARPLSLMRRKPAAHVPCIEMIAFVAIIKALFCEPQSMNDLVGLSGSYPGTIRRILQIGRDTSVVHIADWDRNRCAGAYAPYYAIGVGKPDKKRPEAIPRTAVEKRYRDSIKLRKQQSMFTFQPQGVSA